MVGVAINVVWLLVIDSKEEDACAMLTIMIVFYCS